MTDKTMHELQKEREELVWTTPLSAWDIQDQLNRIGRLDIAIQTKKSEGHWLTWFGVKA